MVKKTKKEKDWLDKYWAEYDAKPDMGEIEWRVLLKEQVINRGLGYDNKNTRFEAERTDLRVVADDKRPHIVFETKIRDGDLETGKTLEQALGYLRGGEIYVILASPIRMKVFSPTGRMQGEINLKKPDRRDRGLFWSVSAANLEAEDYLEDFRTGKTEFCYIPVNEDNLDRLIEGLRICNDLLYAYVAQAWDKYERSYYGEYIPRRDDFEKKRERTYSIQLEKMLEKERIYFIDKARRELDQEFSVPREIFEKSFPAFQAIQPYSRAVDKPKELQDIYFTDVVYSALNKILFIRIVEDKGFIGRKISNGGISVWRSFVTFLRDAYPELLNVAYHDAAFLYPWFFEPGLFDWYIKDDGALNRVLERVFFLLNAFDFKEVDENVLAELYQEFLPPEKRKKLGEFYTPREVTEYILKEVGWPGPGKILDFACGSGGFVVPAAQALLAELKSKRVSAAERLNALNRVVGFDINPFATHITVMNLLFATLNTYDEARRRGERHAEEYNLPKFNVFNIDSLVGWAPDVEPSLLADIYYNDQLEAAEKMRDAGAEFQYVVGNPPYIRNERLSPEGRAAYKEAFSRFRKGNTDISNYFLLKGLDWLEEGTKLGVIVSLGVADADSAALVRDALSQNRIDKVVPLEWCKVFSASVNPFLLFLTKTPPPEGHKVKIVPGIRTLDDLTGPPAEVCEEVEQDRWLGLAPDGSWRLQLTAGDLPVLEKLNRCPKPLSAGWGAATRTKDDRKELISDDPKELGKPVPVLDGREVRAWSIDWQGRYIDYREEILSDAKSRAFFDETQVIVPNVSLTAQAVVFKPERFTVFLNTLMGCNIAKSEPVYPNDAYLSAGLINSLVPRYYALLNLRAGVVQKFYSHFYVRVLESLPFPAALINDQRLAAAITRGSASAHDLAREMVGGDRAVTEKLDKIIAGATVPFAQHPSADFRPYISKLDVATTEVFDEGVLQDDSLSSVRGDVDVLKYILYRALLEGRSDLSKRVLEAAPVPRDGPTLAEALTILEEWFARKPTLGEKLRALEAELDDLVLDAYSELTKNEKKYIKRRVKEFPLSEVIKTELPGAPTRVIAVKRWKPGERYA